MYSWSSNLSQISSKTPSGKFQIFAEIDMTRARKKKKKKKKKKGYLAAILKQYKYFIFFAGIWLWLV